MPPVEDTPEFLAAREELHNQIAAGAQTFGPRVGTQFLRGWVLVTAWVDADDGEQTLVRMSSATLAEYERVGMLHEALYSMASEDDE